MLMMVCYCIKVALLLMFADLRLVHLLDEAVQSRDELDSAYPDAILAGDGLDAFHFCRIEKNGCWSYDPEGTDAPGC
ncbi:hypothetical protein Nepgr_009364 [Nepenthes gracilis]|uniref:Uncharacterized protein n=1 Tax=Nepenthes gracilis TaxID=150966 RepID=A0AAD3SBC3_NEPGR|nr:hypothetical protein Nepgr_009364 [Nepenthes gracilis]